jgi:hypothetical protein
MGRIQPSPLSPIYPPLLTNLSSSKSYLATIISLVYRFATARRQTVEPRWRKWSRFLAYPSWMVTKRPRSKKQEKLWRLLRRRREKRSDQRSTTSSTTHSGQQEDDQNHRLEIHNNNSCRDSLFGKEVTLNPAKRGSILGQE